MLDRPRPQPEARPTAFGLRLQAVSNAGNQPPRTQRSYGQVLQIKATLFAVGCIGLFGCRRDSTTQCSLTASKEITQRALPGAKNTTKRGGAT